MTDCIKSEMISFTINPDTSQWVISAIIDGFLDVDQDLTGNIYEVMIPERLFKTRGTAFQVRRGESRFELFLEIDQSEIIPLINARVFDKDQLYPGLLCRKNFLMPREDVLKNGLIILLVVILAITGGMLAYYVWKKKYR